MGVATLAGMSRFRLRARYVVLLAIAGMAAFLWNQASRTDMPDLPAELFVVTGTVESYRSVLEGSGTGNRKAVGVLHLVKLREYEGQVEFSLTDAPPNGLTPGTPVRFEMREDPWPSLRAASSYDYASYQIFADGAVVDGTMLYSAAETQLRNDTAVARLRSMSALLWGVVVVWIALLARRHRVFLRSLAQPEGASAAADRLRRIVYRE